jgi:ABC-type dipeptide/oligopeptide/nickel transport system permease component
MLRHAFRRLLWTLPALLGVSLLAFLLLSFVPDPSDDPAVAASMAPGALAERRRERFLDLPRFFNAAPLDVHGRAAAAVRAVVEGGPGAADARRELARLGGAALPHVLPALDELAPEPRARVAVALAPIARRMRLAQADDAADPARAVAFWTRFWDDRGIEFRRAVVRSAVRRLARYGSESRAADLYVLDTFSLEEVLAALERPTDAASVERARALVAIAAHVTGRPDAIGPSDGVDAARACVERWQAFWSVHGADYVVFAGPTRVAAMVLETRYGKWALGALALRFGVASDGRPVLDELARRAPITLVLVFGAIALGYALAVLGTALAAAARRRALDVALAGALLLLYAVPTAVAAELAARSAGAGAARLLAGVVVLALGLVASPASQERSALRGALSADFVRAAVGRGASRLRATFVHALPRALLPVVTLATLEAPMALGGAFVVERVLGLPGLGEATVRAVGARDTAWLMALALFAGAAASLGVLVSDLARVRVDPRLAPNVFARSRRA